MQWSVRINEAYQRLKDPLKRAAYLCELKGAPIQAENNTAMPAAFLMQQMQWREDLEDARDSESLERMADDVAAARSRMLLDLQQAADVQRDFPALAGQVRALMFVERFARDVENRLDQLGNRRRPRNRPIPGFTETPSPWHSCRFPNPASPPTPINAGWRWASTLAPRILW